LLVVIVKSKYSARLKAQGSAKIELITEHITLLIPYLDTINNQQSFPLPIQKTIDSAIKPKPMCTHIYKLAVTKTKLKC